MRSIFAALLFATSLIASDVPELEVTPAAATPPVEVIQPPKGSATKLDLGKMFFLSMPSYTGNLEFDPPEHASVSMFRVKSEMEFPTFKQGFAKAVTAKAPKSGSDVLAIFGEARGTITLVAWGIKDNRPLKVGQRTIQVGDGGDFSVVPPMPKPTPEGKLKEGFVVVLYDNAAMTAPVAKLLGDTAWKRSVEKIPGVLDFRTYDVSVNDPAGRTSGYIAKANEQRPDKKANDWSNPVVLFLDSKNVVDVRLLGKETPTGPEFSKAFVESTIKEVIKP